MDPRLEREVAGAMEADVRLLPVLPELLADFWELGVSADRIVSAIETVGVAEGSTVLDLGSGKGAVAVALAERLRLKVLGIDAFPPFLEASKALAEERGVTSLCSFREGDLRDFLGKSGRYDVVLLSSLGPVSGDHQRTVAQLRGLVRPGGHIVIDDGFLAESVTSPPPGYEGYVTHDETVARLTASGDRLVWEFVCPAAETRAENERNTGLIRRRAVEVKKVHPELADAIDQYVARQERETRILGAVCVCATWVVRKGSSRVSPAEARS